jgi:ubiquinone/menaquinone biosynthesis C-methylase UbiE/DNA-binding transcriptional ArsR family regulator
MKKQASLFARLGTLADPIRCRLLLLLDRHELTVSELIAVLQLPQSTVSRHLRVLADDGWVAVRTDGPSHLYRMAGAQLEAGARRLWQLVREQLTGTMAAAADAQRLAGVLAHRRTRSQEFFSKTAGRWDSLRTELFGTRPDLGAALGFLGDDWTVGDLGCGTGQFAAALAPFVHRVIAVDESRAMLGAARRRLGHLDNVELRSGSLEALPVEDGELDAAALFLVLHYAVEPVRVLAEARRALRSAGRLVVVDMVPHDREEYRQRMEHLWTGFSSEQMTGWLEDAGLKQVRYRLLPPDPRAKGPALFAATARRD